MNKQASIIDLTIILETEVQLRAFMVLLNSDKPLTIYDLMSRTDISKTTLIDNLKKLRERYIRNDENYPYVETDMLFTGKKGRPKTLFFVSNRVKNILGSVYLHVLDEVEIIETNDN